jgi:hypothetical protein
MHFFSKSSKGKKEHNSFFTALPLRLNGIGMDYNNNILQPE